MTNLEELWADGQLLALDLESTDVDPRRDRLVTASIVTITPSRTGGKPQIETRNWLADPGIDIPADATALHGITTDYARTHGRPAAEVVEEVSSHLARIWTATVPLIVFNAPFDLTMLDAELRRHHGRGFDLSGPVVDPICIDRHLHPKRAEKRTLANLCQHYKVRLDQAHSSADDAVAAARLAWRLATAEPERIGRLAPRTLHNQQAKWFREQQRSRATDLEYRLGRLPRSDTARIDRLQQQISDARAAATAWPLLPETTAAPARRVLPPRPGGPARSHASWTPALKAELREQWLTADCNTAPETLHDQLAEQHCRSVGAICSRLIKLQCDIDAPGQSCTPERAAELKARIEAEYAVARA
ncbi:exonuclease domain-containing protein [Amycolatopsis sp. H20-H5]|uniref:exonuclease domain-containing protein n=1 Tax=Amycolatopsis sp. H20-H5 TaxID=3046309 RepID=UPI002DBCAD4A|nr:exonuclease domain-containing protein [Amycolatopsis sp. H20-H5]MEC3978929.1 exonuclease domain-containing protein [Amycolatopsis sp. H20-H5]